MRLGRHEGMAWCVIAVALSAAGCATPAVGDPCLPEQVPETGFAPSETYIETSSVQCETRVCMVYRLDGNPLPDCVDRPPDPNCSADDPTCDKGVKCVKDNPPCSDDDITRCPVSNRVYCTCRCNAGDTGFEECECPDDYSCVDVLEQGGPGVRGGYCVKNRTFSKN